MSYAGTARLNLNSRLRATEALLSISLMPMAAALAEAAAKGANAEQSASKPQQPVDRRLHLDRRFSAEQHESDDDRDHRLDNALDQVLATSIKGETCGEHERGRDGCREQAIDSSIGRGRRADGDREERRREKGQPDGRGAEA